MGKIRVTRQASDLLSFGVADITPPAKFCPLQHRDAPTGLAWPTSLFPGRCPGLTYCGPSARQGQDHQPWARCPGYEENHGQDAHTTHRGRYATQSDGSAWSILRPAVHRHVSGENFILHPSYFPRPGPSSRTWGKLPTSSFILRTSRSIPKWCGKLHTSYFPRLGPSPRACEKHPSPFPSLVLHVRGKNNFNRNTLHNRPEGAKHDSPGQRPGDRPQDPTALKGQNITAQGNALGSGRRHYPTRKILPVTTA